MTPRLAVFELVREVTDTEYARGSVALTEQAVVLDNGAADYVSPVQVLVAKINSLLHSAPGGANAGFIRRAKLVMDLTYP